MLRYNIENMSDTELSELSKAIIAEKEKRNNVKRKQAWNAVRTAIMDYCRLYGDIEVLDHSNDDEWHADLDIHSDLEEIGCMRVG